MDARALTSRLQSFDPAVRSGQITRVTSTYVEANGPDAPIGALCSIESSNKGQIDVPATVVAIQSGRIVLAPYESLDGARLGSVVRLVARKSTVGVGDGLLGRAIDGLGRPIDDLGTVRCDQIGTAGTQTTTPLDRVTPNTILTTGLRAIDGLLTLARGQRIGVFAAPGVGKTTLLTQLARQVLADRCVLCLVGERGREVEATWNTALDAPARERCVMVAATSDQSAAMRIQAVEQALAISEAWRAQGLHVLLLIDSVTRYAMALREIGLAAGEPPTVRAYTPGVFAALPRLVERCGALRSGGAITAVMTVLSETDDVDDPISEMMKSLLDGHIILSRALAEQGRHPAIDIPRSISRLAHGLRSPPHRQVAEKALGLIASYEMSRTLIDAGVYTAGANAETDAAIRQRPALEAFLRQADGTHSTFDATLNALRHAGGV